MQAMYDQQSQEQAPVRTFINGQPKWRPRVLGGEGRPRPRQMTLDDAVALATDMAYEQIRQERERGYAYGGNLFEGGGSTDDENLYGDIFPDNPFQLKYRGRPTIIHKGRFVPKRVRSNTSKTTRKRSEALENGMRRKIVNHQMLSGGSNPAFDIPYIPEKSIILNGSTTSTNVLDSLAKYAGIHNRNPKISEHSILGKSKYGTPRKINKNEMLGLAAQETHMGAMPYSVLKENDKEYNRALSNSNYFTAFGYIPADNLVNDYHYNKDNVSRKVPPLLDAFQYFAQGDYNRGDKRHTRDVNNTGAKIWKDADVQKWWESSGKYWYNNPDGLKK